MFESVWRDDVKMSTTRVEVETQGKGNIGNKPGFSRVSFPRNNRSTALGVSGF